MQVVMAMGGNRMPRKGNKMPRHAAVEGNRRQLAFVACFSKIPLFVWQFAEAAFKVPVKRGSVHMLCLHIAHVFIIPKGAPKSLGSTFAGRIDFGFYLFYTLLIDTFLRNVSETGCRVVLRHRLHVLCLVRHERTDNLSGIGRTVDGYLLVVVVVIYRSEIVNLRAHDL